MSIQITTDKNGKEIAYKDKWNSLCDYDAELEADIEFEVDKQWIDPLQTERELFDAMVSRQEKDQLDSDKHEIYNSLDYLMSVMNERFTEETAYDLLVVWQLQQDFPKSLVEQIAADVLSVQVCKNGKTKPLKFSEN